MRTSITIALICWVLSSTGHAAESADPILTAGLQAWLTNGAEAGLKSWYSDSPDIAFEMKEKLLPIIKDLGRVIDTEVVAIQPISKRVTRYYVAVYFARSPLWIRVDRYAGDGKTSYLPMLFSVNPDRILPGYLTEFQL